jgi:hypothetical protein
MHGAVMALIFKECMRSNSQFSRDILISMVCSGNAGIDQSISERARRQILSYSVEYAIVETAEQVLGVFERFKGSACDDVDEAYGNPG